MLCPADSSYEIENTEHSQNKPPQLFPSNMNMTRGTNTLITSFAEINKKIGDNAETSTLVSLDIDRQKWSRLIFVDSLPILQPLSLKAHLRERLDEEKSE